MPGVGETIAALKRVRSAAGDASARVMSETPAFGLNPGALRMLSYVPNGVRRAPLVVVLHGCTQTAEAHAEGAGWLSLAERHGFAVLAPEQRVSNNPNRCFNWFQPEDIARDCGEAASIRDMVAAMLSAYDLDPERVFITGLSAGGAMTSVMLAAYPDVFAGGAIIAGLPHGAADSMQSAFVAMRGGGYSADHLAAALKRGAPAGARVPRVTIWHGDADNTVSASNASEISKQWLVAHGLVGQAGHVEIEGRRTRTTWRASESGEVLVESNIVRGMGHGTPLAALGEGGVGAAGPYMLEVELSAATEIARFWGVAGNFTPRSATPRTVVMASSKTEARGIGERLMASLSGRVPASVDAIITKALRSAGLLP